MVKTDDRIRSSRRQKGARHLVSAALRFLGAYVPLVVALSFGVLSPTAAVAQNGIGMPLGERPALVNADGSPLEIEDLDGNEVNLADYVGGRPALVEFWAIWCELCEALHPQMVEVHARYRDRVGFVAIAVGVAQSQRSVRRHLEDTPAEFPTLWDGRGQAVRAFAAPGTSYIVVLDAEGRVTYTGSGSGQDIEVAVLTGL